MFSEWRVVWTAPNFSRDCVTAQSAAVGQAGVGAAHKLGSAIVR